jgi:NAD(P)-dependent dehydrogenase (short-subunit alcohol dehydrogenase family)
MSQASGRIIDLTSASAHSDPQSSAGDGGWDISYWVTKAALHGPAGLLAGELEPNGILVINVDPAHIATERIAQDMCPSSAAPRTASRPGGRRKRSPGWRSAMRPSSSMATPSSPSSSATSTHCSPAGTPNGLADRVAPRPLRRLGGRAGSGRAHLTIPSRADDPAPATVARLGPPQAQPAPASLNNPTAARCAVGHRAGITIPARLASRPAPDASSALTAWGGYSRMVSGGFAGFSCGARRSSCTRWTFS